MEIRVIKTDKEYRSALNEAERLVGVDPAVGTKDAERLELLTVLIEDFEKKNFQFDAVDPIEAIEFRMAEQGLRQKDLVPLIGSRSRTSEVLARKRPLTVQMIRALSSGFGIPLEALIAEPGTASRPMEQPDELDWNKFPVREMDKRGWFKSLKVSSFKSSEEIIRAFLSQIGGGTPAPALFRRSFRGEEITQKAYYSVLAWTARVLVRAKQSSSSKQTFDPGRITPDLLRDLARLSWFEEGPRLAIEFLAKCGILIVVEPRLPNTLLDGAAMLMEKNVPVVGLTLRFDRVDYFWFTLLHEVAHIWRHLHSVDEAFIDRVENLNPNQTAEKEANRIARDALIPRAIWKRSSAFLSPTKHSIQQLADDLHIHPGIVAGRLQCETGRYENFREFLGPGAVRKWFPEAGFH